MRWAAAALGLLALLTLEGRASAQIKQPGAHPIYSVELEPHLALQHDRDWRADDDGWGPGLRATIPFLQNGPIPKINNSMGIGFGLDWLMFDNCDGPGRVDNCDVKQMWFPVVLQWNFFFTPIVSVFGEPGLAGRYRSFNVSPCSNFSNDPDECDVSDFDFFEPVFFAGGRFLFSESVGLVVRVGTPYISVGATFLL